MDKYIPPYDITEEMLELTSEIMELLGELKNVNDLEKLPRLRRVSRIKSIHSSLAIENNTLTLKQVTDVIEGKRVLGPEDASPVRGRKLFTFIMVNQSNHSIQNLLRGML